MVGYWQGCRLVIIIFGLILMFMSAADALRRQCSQAFGVSSASCATNGLAQLYECCRMSGIHGGQLKSIAKG